nr:uncharacterized protein LOC111515389 [Leptinotarsa decemlineata]
MLMLNGSTTTIQCSYDIEDAVDVLPKQVENGHVKKIPSIETLNSEMPCRDFYKDRRRKAFKSLLNRLRWKKYASATISRPDPSYRVVYLGNVVTGWAQDKDLLEKPLATLWKNYTQSSRADIRMQLTVSGGGLRATTKDHGLTEYWAHRLTTCATLPQFPRLFCWVYRHEGKRLRHELRCHAVVCSTSAVAKQIEDELKHFLALALFEFKRDKLSRQNARLSLVNSVYENPTIPRRKILLSTGSHNYKPPLERSKSAPKLTSIEEIIEEEDDAFESPKKLYKEILKRCDITDDLPNRRKYYLLNRFQHHYAVIPEMSSICRTPVLDRNEVGENGSDLNKNESDAILEQLKQGSLSNDLLESCERAWFNALNQEPDSDKKPLSSYESANIALSDLEQPVFQTIKMQADTEIRLGKTINVDFKVGGCLSSRGFTFEKIDNSDILNFCELKSLSKPSSLGSEDVSLIPVGENQPDFNSLTVFKRRSLSDPCFVGRDSCTYDDENSGACSDESGFEEEELANSVGNIVLV